MPISQFPPLEIVQGKLLFSATPPALVTATVFAGGLLVAWGAFGLLLKWNWRRAAGPLAVLALAAGLVVVPYLNARVQEAKDAAKEAGELERAKELVEKYKFEETFPLVPEGKPWHWALLAFGLALAVEFVARLPGVPVAVANLLRGAGAGLVAATVLPADWQKGIDRWILPLLAGVIVAQWAVIDAVSRRNPGGTHAACLTIVAFGLAGVAIHDDQGRFTEFATFVAAALGVLAVGGWVTRTDTGGAAAVATVPVVSVLVLTRHMAVPFDPDEVSKVPVICYWLVGLAPLVLGLFLIPPLARFGTRWYATPVKLLLVAIPVGVALYLCVTEAAMSFDGIR